MDVSFKRSKSLGWLLDRRYHLPQINFDPKVQNPFKGLDSHHYSLLEFNNHSIFGEQTQSL
jgi:hypothetical protein